MSQKQNSDGTKIKGNANRQISAKKRICVKSKAEQQYVGLDVHKESIQVAVMDKDGKVLGNTKISNRNSEIREMFAKIPDNTRCVMESSYAKEIDGLQSVHSGHACEMNVIIIIIIVITVRTLICVDVVEGDPRIVTAERF